MIKYYCDLCEKECNSRTFAIPIAATFLEEEPCDLLPIAMHLCSPCRRNIYKTIEKITSRSKIKELNKFALDVKMKRV